MTERAFRRYLDLEPSADEPVLVLVAGVPGSGKSTLASRWPGTGAVRSSRWTGCWER